MRYLSFRARLWSVSVVLRQLALASVRNNGSADAARQRPVAAALFEVYSALSCCFLSADALAEAFLPGLRCLLRDLDAERAKIAASILRDAEQKLPSPGYAAAATAPSDRSVSESAREAFFLNGKRPVV